MRFFHAPPPEVATPRVFARTTGFFWVLSGFAALAISTGFWAWRVRWAVTALTALVAIGTGALLLLVASRRALPRWLFHTMMVVGTGLITVVTAIAPVPAVAVAFAAGYVFVAVDAFFFFAWPEALLHLIVMLVAQTAALSVQGPVGLAASAGLAFLWTGTAVVVGSIVRIASSASRDSLTGLVNRRGWDEALEAALALGDRKGQPLSVALVDVDHFKQINDVHGHAAGDDLLRGLAADWSSALPPDAVLARRGGDEFALLIPGRTGEDALALVEEMRTAGAHRAISCGVAQQLPGESGGDLLRRTDAALYAAKVTGRGRTVLSGHEHDSVARELARALSEGQIDVAFLPILALPAQEVVGVEALARWVHPRWGTVPPAEFVPAAESAGLIVALGSAVLRQATRGALQLQQAWGRELVLSVNVSGRELTEPDYAAGVLRTLAETGWPAQRLVVEVTESLVEGSTAAALHCLEELRSHRIAVAIDDFGTGYSAFSRLDVLPADYLKLDHSFITPICSSRRRLAMLRALLDLSRDLGLQVIAEGVETEAQARLLIEIGCPLVQGYLFGRPAPVALCVLPTPRTPSPAETRPAVARGGREPAI